MKSTHFVSFGSALDNLERAVATSTLGFRRENIPMQLLEGATVYLYCKQKIYAIAQVSSKLFIDNTNKIWSDEQYPYRVNLKEIVALSAPLKVSEESIGCRIDQYLGRGWGYKYVSVPRSLPPDFVAILESVLAKQETTTVPKLLSDLKALIQGPKRTSTSIYRF